MTILKCFVCLFRSGNISQLIQHLRCCHFPIEHNLSLKCCSDSCSLIFKTYSGFRKHLKNCKQLTDIENNLEDTTINDDISENASTCQLNVNDHDYTFDGNADIDKTEYQTMDENFVNLAYEVNIHIVSLISEILSFGIPLTANIKITDSIRELTQTILESVKEICKGRHFQQNIDLFSNKVLHYFEKYDSEYKIKKHYLNTMVEPKEISVGVRIEQVFDKRSNTYIQCNKPNKFVYVPILDTLAYILKNKQIQPFF